MQTFEKIARDLREEMEPSRNYELLRLFRESAQLDFLQGDSYGRAADLLGT